MMGNLKEQIYTQETIREVILSAGVMDRGHFIFANGEHALTKIKMERLFDHRQKLEFVLNALSRVDTSSADLILGVPTGGQQLADELFKHSLLGRVPVVPLERVPGGARQDFQFCSVYGRQMARTARRVLIYDDVVTTLSSVAGVVRLLEPDRQQIDVVAIWRRGRELSQYRQGINSTHYLIEEEIPQFSLEECPYCCTT